MARGSLSLGDGTCGGGKRPFPLPLLEKQLCPDLAVMRRAGTGPQPQTRESEQPHIPESVHLCPSCLGS